MKVGLSIPQVIRVLVVTTLILSSLQNNGLFYS